MKKNITLLLLLLFLVACTDKNIRENNSNPEEPRYVFMRSESVSYSVEMLEKLSIDKHKSFCTGTMSNYITDPVANALGDGPIPIESSEIPVWRYSSSIQSVYNDGTIDFDMASKAIDEAPTDKIAFISVSSIIFDAIPQRAVYSNGIITLYGNNGTVLHSGHQPQPDMRQFCDSVAHYYAKYSDHYLTTTKSSSHNVDSVILFVQSQFNKAEVPTYTIEKVSGGKLLIEYGESDYYNKIIISSDLKMTYSTQTFNNNQLVSQTLFEYASENEIDDYSISVGEIKIATPRKVTTQKLLFGTANTPMVSTKIVGYEKNKIDINLNNYYGYEKIQ